MTSIASESLFNERRKEAREKLPGNISAMVEAYVKIAVSRNPSFSPDDAFRTKLRKELEEQLSQA